MFGEVDDLDRILFDVRRISFFGFVASDGAGGQGSFLLTEGGGMDDSSWSGVWMGSSVGALMGSFGGCVPIGLMGGRVLGSSADILVGFMGCDVLRGSFRGSLFDFFAVVVGSMFSSFSFEVALPVRSSESTFASTGVGVGDGAATLQEEG